MWWTELWEVGQAKGAVAATVLTLMAIAMAAWSWNKKNKRKKSWPTVPGSFLVGNALEMGSATRRTAQLHEWADRYGAECGVFEINLAGAVFVCVCRQDVTLEILRQRPWKVVRNAKLRSAVQSCSADGLFSNEGDDWKHDKRLVAPTLNHAAVSKYFPSVKTVTQRLLNKWTDLSCGGAAAVGINQDCYQVMIDLAGLVFLGTDFDALRNPNNVSAKDVADVGAIVTRRALSPVEYWRIPLVGNYLDGGGWIANRIRRSMEEIIAHHEEEEEEKAEKGDDATSLVAKLVAVNQNDKDRLSRRRVMGNVLTMFVGGTDSSAATLATSIWLLATDTTGLQEELAEEASKINLDTVTLDELLAALPRLQSFLYETQRMYSAFSALFLDVAQEIPFLDTTLPVGTHVLTLLRYTSTNPHHAPTGVPLGPNNKDHTQYCPRRWLVKGPKEEVSVQAPNTKLGAFLPFGHGMRSCPGRGFAESMSLFCLSSLLARFHLELEKNHPPVGRMSLFAEFPDINVRVHFRPRTKRDG